MPQNVPCGTSLILAPLLLLRAACTRAVDTFPANDDILWRARFVDKIRFVKKQFALSRKKLCFATNDAAPEKVAVCRRSCPNPVGV